MKNVLLWMALSVCAGHGAAAQSLCTSDGQAAPLTLVEHFISADCAACWSAAPTAHPGPQELSIDWIVPSDQGDEAPLSAAALREAQTRLAALGRASPASSTVTRSRVLNRPGLQLRVAQGLPLGAYLGAIIEFQISAKVRRQEPLTAWLLLVETVPAGVEGAAVEKNLVRNVLISSWDRPDQRPATGPARYRELRPLNVPEGTKPERLRLIGWVQDARGQVLSAAQSVCTTAIETH
ncbi:MAG: hypothetical protein PHS32_19525 [Rhodoferax sp.]|uniref:hypothetical protein n=1 Tax=Rhodoferax sp. TaxID=50421 RepID=UPI0026273F5B|nr:hypothetical protein [Rhodoferax sp.]MDD5335930.1 hypothetical protein [Rhodoferax sp.]